MELNRYNVKYWSSVDWGWTNCEVLAESEDQVRVMVEKDCKAEFRIKSSVYPVGSQFYEEPKDSLEIVNLGEVQLPYTLN